MQDTLQELLGKLKDLPEKSPRFVELATAWAITHGIKILLILIGMWVLIMVGQAIGKRIIKIAEDDDPSTENERERRAKTMAQILNFVVKTVVIVFGAITIIKEIGFDIAPILAGAGIIGLAIGFGSQSLVKDIVSGFFLILENQIRVGDVVKIGDVSGTVEKITLRIVVLRDAAAVVHVVPNGEIKVLSNMTYGWSQAVVDIKLAYKADVDKVMVLLKELSKSLADEKQFKNYVLAEPSVFGIEEFGDLSMTLRVIFKTMPLKQWEVAREFRRRVKNEFDRQGIDIPFPQHVIHLSQKDDSKDTPDKPPSRG